MDVAWQPPVFMKTYISGLIRQTLPKMLHFFVFQMKGRYSSSYSDIENSSIYHSFSFIHPPTVSGNLQETFCKTVWLSPFYINYTCVSRPPSVLVQATPFSTEMILPKLQLLPFFIFPVWPPHLPMRSLKSQLGWAQLSSVEWQWALESRRLFLPVLLPNIASTYCESSTLGVVSPKTKICRDPHNSECSLHGLPNGRIHFC